MPGGRSVRGAAADMDIDKSTSFRWRHRFLSWAGEDQPEALHGITEADEMFFRYSNKGQRGLERPARKRGGGKAEQVCVLVARDRSCQTLAKAMLPTMCSMSTLTTAGCGNGWCAFTA